MSEEPSAGGQVARALAPATGREAGTQGTSATQGAPAVASRPTSRLGLHALQRAAGNQAVTRLVQRQGGGGGMSSPKGASVPGSAPASSDVSGAQQRANKAADDLLKDFSQSGFRDFRDWDKVTDDKKFKLIDKATDLTEVFWVGPYDEEALERCWSSFGDRFTEAVKTQPILWNRSIYRGADPDNINQTKGMSERFKKDVLAAAEANLDQNEDRVVKEFQAFGLEPPWQLVRPSQPERNKFAGGPAPSVGGPTAVDLLAEQSRLAKVVLRYDIMLKGLQAMKAGLAVFNPLNRPPADQDVDVAGGLTSWDVANQQWVRISSEVALILNAWPVLYSAHATGTLHLIANQSYDKPDPSKPFDPKIREQREAGLEAVRAHLTGVLTSIKKVRDQGLDPLDLTPVHQALWSGRIAPKSGQVPVREIMVGILDDERKTRDFEAAMAKLAIDVALMAAMITGIVGTMGGAAIAIGVAGAAAARAEEKADHMKAAYGATVTEAGALVTREAVDAAEAEAEQAKIELAQTAVTSLLEMGVGAVGHHLQLKEQARARQLLDQIHASEGARAGSKTGELRGRLRAAAGAGTGPAGQDLSPMKPWGVAPELRPATLKEPVNVRLRGQGVPELRGIVRKSEVAHAQFNASDWTIEMHPRFFEGDAISQAKFDQLIELTYHEARHGFQTYQVARWRAMKLARGEPLTERFAFEIHPDVARQVRPMQPGDPFEALAATWHESIYGAKSAARDQIYKAKDAAQAVLERQTQHVKRLPPSTPLLERRMAENQLELNRLAYEKHYLAYRQLPEEVDAYALAGQQGQWARSGLNRNFQVRVDAAQAALDSANVRVAESAQELALYQRRGITGEALDEARATLDLAKADAAQASQRLAEVKSSY